MNNAASETTLSTLSTPKLPPSTISLHPAFQLIQYHHIEALSIEVVIARHSQTGAMHYHLAHSSDENAFLVGFRTQPMDSKGVAHILEHTALCGSAKYPVRDPFFAMIKRSLNTFMNAMTAADWTAYPFATQNKNDYFNLLSVYLDASFFPKLHPLDFAQEGIRVELDEQDQPQFKGIVFNEMKGAMSAEIDQLYHAIAKHVFPTTTYHYNSGGDPADMPDLTHKELVEFHNSHYHPSNCILMSFGNFPIIETQTRLHEDALKNFEQGHKHASHPERRLSAPIAVTETYCVDSITEAQTHHVIAWLLPSITDPKMRLALRLLEGVLIEHAGSPLRAYLDSHDLGRSPTPLLGLDDSHYEMVFYTGLQGSEPEHANAIEQGIVKLLQSVADKPIAAEAIETILHQIELDQRHIGGDSLPYGLNLMLEGFSTAIHDGNPLDVWEVDEHLVWLREQVQNPNWLPQLLTTHLLDNPHRVRLTLVPDSEKTAKLAAQEQARLDTINANLTEADKVALKQQSQQLAARQSAVDDLSLLPKVGVEDVPNTVALMKGVNKPIRLRGYDSTLYQYEVGTNGLYYYQVILNLTHEDSIIEHPLLPLYLGLVAELGTDSLSAREFQALQAAHSSGVTARISQRTAVDDKQSLSSYFVIATRALNRKPEAIDLVKQVLEHSVFDDIERIKELLQQKQLSWQSRLSDAGYAYAMQTASRGMSRQAKLEYVRSGLPALNALKAFLNNANREDRDSLKSQASQNLPSHSQSNAQSDYSKHWHSLAQSLMALHDKIACLPKRALIICESDKTERLSQLIVHSLTSTDKKIPAKVANDTSVIPHEFGECDLAKNDGDTQDLAWLVATNVYHNAAVYAATPAGHPDTAALMVLAPYLRNGFLHSVIREQGGAYGGGASYDANACAFKFFSYRDPHCGQTFDYFQQSIHWLLNDAQTSEQLEEAILGIISAMDKPGSPAGEAAKSCFAELHNRGETWLQKLRANILAVTHEDLKHVATTYLLDKPFVRATLAPYDKEESVKALGFKIHKISS